MTILDKLEMAEIILKNLSGCINCEQCSQLAKEYFSGVDYVEQMEREQSLDN